MNNDKVIINGSTMDKDFFEDNLKEARSLDWERFDASTIADHSHCIVCTIALPNDTNGVAYGAKNLVLCRFCHDTYLE